MTVDVDALKGYVLASEDLCVGEGEYVGRGKLKECLLAYYGAFFTVDLLFSMVERKP